MSNSPRQPRPDDAVLGGQYKAPIDGAVLGGVEGVRQRLATDNIEVKKVALTQALNYGEKGVEVLFEVLEKESNLDVYWSAYQLLEKQNNRATQIRLKNFRKAPKLPENALINITATGKIYWCLPGAENPQAEIDPVVFEQAIPNEAPLIVVGDHGKAYPVTVKEISPLAIGTISLLDLLPPSAQKETEKVIGQFFVTPDLSQNLLLLTCQGRLKRLFSSELQKVKQQGLSLLKLKENDRLQFLQFVQSQQFLILATSGGRLLRFFLHEDRIIPMSRQSQGLPAVRLRPQESLVGSLGVNIQKSVLLLTAKGYGKALGVEHLRQGNLGDIGTTAIQFTHKSDHLLALLPNEAGFCIRLQTNLENVFILTPEQFSP